MSAASSPVRSGSEVAVGCGGGSDRVDAIATGAGDADAASGGSGTEPQAVSVPTMAATPRKRFMLLILLEALLALLLLVGIVWWTMFSGRKGGEPPAVEPERDERKHGPE